MDCVEWPGSRTAAGYGRVGNVYAHRFIWELLNGPIPEGLYVLHHCDNPSCVNPKHLFMGTHTDNMLDKESKGRGGNRAKWKDGQFHGTSKLTIDQVREIKRRVRIGHAGGKGKYRGNAHDLAREYGVRPGTIYGIASRTSWAQVSPDEP